MKARDARLDQLPGNSAKSILRSCRWANSQDDLSIGRFHGAFEGNLKAPISSPITRLH